MAIQCSLMKTIKINILHINDDECLMKKNSNNLNTYSIEKESPPLRVYIVSDVPDDQTPSTLKSVHGVCADTIDVDESRSSTPEPMRPREFTVVWSQAKEARFQESLQNIRICVMYRYQCV